MAQPELSKCLAGGRGYDGAEGGQHPMPPDCVAPYAMAPLVFGWGWVGSVWGAALTSLFLPSPGLPRLPAGHRPQPPQQQGHQPQDGQQVGWTL